MLKKNILPIFTLMLIDVIIFISDDMYLPGSLQIARDLKTTEGMINSTFAIFFLGGAIFCLTGRKIIQVLSPKRTITLSMMMFGITSLLLFYVKNISSMMFLRVIQGGLCSIILIGNNTFIHLNFKRVVAAQITSVVNSTGMMAPILGPVLGAVIINYFSWRYTFLFTSILCVFSLLLISFSLKETSKKEVDKFTLKDFICILKIKDFWCVCIPSILLFGCMLVWIIESPVIFLKFMSSYKFGFIQFFILISFSFGLITSVRVMNKLRFVDIINKGLIAVNVIAFCFFIASYFNLFVFELLFVAFLLFFIAFIHGAMERVGFEIHPGKMSTVIVLNGFMSEVIWGAMILFFSFIKDKSIFLVSSVMLFAIILSTFLYLKSNFHKKSN